MKVDPIIAVKDVEASSRWYQAVFGWTIMHGGPEFDILVSVDGAVQLCLHPWEVHGHPSMEDSSIQPGNGLLLYYRAEGWLVIRENVRKMDWPVAADVHLNPNSRRKEFSIWDPDGYYWTVTEMHVYEG